MAKKISITRLDAAQAERQAAATTATEHADYLEEQIAGLREDADKATGQAAAIAQARAILAKADVTEF